MAKGRSVLVRVEEEDFLRWTALAREQGMTFSRFCREAMRAVERRNEVGRNVPKEPTTLERAVREPVVAAVGVGRVGEVSSASFEEGRRRARMLAERDGRCTADVSQGVRCRLCGEVHR